MPSRGIIRRKSDRSQKIVIEMIDKLFSAWFIIQNVACLLNSHKSLDWNTRFHLVSTLTRTFACHTWHRETVAEAVQRNGTTSSRLHHAEYNRNATDDETNAEVGQTTECAAVINLSMALCLYSWEHFPLLLNLVYFHGSSLNMQSVS